MSKFIKTSFSSIDKSDISCFQAEPMFGRDGDVEKFKVEAVLKSGLKVPAFLCKSKEELEEKIEEVTGLLNK